MNKAAEVLTCVFSGKEDASYWGLKQRKNISANHFELFELSFTSFRKTPYYKGLREYIHFILNILMLH